ncbi:MAG: aminoacyl-tRNA hydrolase [Anaerolineae bacterium]|nr:aminoacyl-tRNA hydrolase [Anaerolineae bacterium]
MLIVGLGNPGPEYAGNRHNAGFQCLARFAERYGLRFSYYRFRASLASGSVLGRGLLLARPLTYMNESGQAVQPLVRHYGISLAELLIVYDDLDLPLGRIRLRARGSSGGHRGLESIIRHLGTTEFPRLRLGIGRPPNGDAVEYVLSDWLPEERPVMEAAYERAVEAIACFVREGIVAAMNRYNAGEE